VSTYKSTTNLQEIEQLYIKSATFHKILQLLLYNKSSTWTSGVRSLRHVLFRHTGLIESVNQMAWMRLISERCKVTAGRQRHNCCVFTRCNWRCNCRRNWLRDRLRRQLHRVNTQWRFYAGAKATNVYNCYACRWSFGHSSLKFH